MKHSESLNEILSALSKFQGELDNASKGKQGHGYKYADLAECINTAKPVLAANGLSVTQLLSMNDIGEQTIITMLGHSSGQFISSECKIANAKLQGGAGSNPVQVLGSAITYMRRYAYAAIIGLAQEDDDGHGIKRKPQPQKKLEMSEDLGSWVMSELNQGKAMDHIIEILKADWQIDQTTINQIKAIGGR